MNTLVKDKYICIDRKENKESLSGLQRLFDKKFEEIEEYRENQSSDQFQQRYAELVEINHRIRYYPVG